MTQIFIQPPVHQDVSPIGDEVIGTIQGQTPGSKEEWRVAQALEKMEIRYIYQYEILDRYVRGGLVIDFLALTVPLSTPIEVYGEYWHRGELRSRDVQRIVQVDDHFRGQAQPLVVLFGKDLPDQDQADTTVRREILNA